MEEVWYWVCTRGEGRVPDEGEGVVEDVGRVWSGLTRVHNVSPVLLSELHLHELHTQVSEAERSESIFTFGMLRANEMKVTGTM